jgi:hypothetical protein
VGGSAENPTLSKFWLDSDLILLKFPFGCCSVLNFESSLLLLLLLKFGGLPMTMD